MGEVLKLDRSLAVARAMSVVNSGIYRLGRGHGNNPRAASPLDRDGLCDCSNFHHWAIGLCMDMPDAYLNTDGVLFDAYGVKRGGGGTTPPRRYFEPVGHDDVALPGDTYVRGGKFELNASGILVRTHPGHIALVVRVDEDFDRSKPLKDQYEKIHIVHCSTFGKHHNPPAIRETNAHAFAGSGYLCRYRHFTLA